MHRYRVRGYDRRGVELFALQVDGISEQDAKLIAMRNMRRTPNGSRHADEAERLDVELMWRAVGVTP